MNSGNEEHYQIRDMPGKSIVEISEVHKKFGDFVALSNINLGIPDSSFVSILGPSGCGKTTLLRLIGGFETPTEGNIIIDGTCMGATPPYRRPVNMVFQDYALFPNMNVFDNIAYGLRGQRPKLTRATIKERVQDALEMVDISDRSQHLIEELSGGQRQRVALARALVNKPKVLLLDEPMAALDKKLRRDVQFGLQTLQNELGVTFIMVTHDQQEAMSLSDQIVVMRDGQIEQIGTPEELYQTPRSEFIADFIGSFNIFDGSVDGVSDTTIRLRYHDQVLEVPKTSGDPSMQGPTKFGFSPSSVFLSPAPESNNLLNLTGKIRNLMFLGDKLECRVELPNGEAVIILLNSNDPNRENIRESAQIYMSVETANIHLLPGK